MLHLITVMRIIIRYSISGSCTTASCLMGIVCLVGGSVNDSSIGSATWSASILAFVFALVLALCVGPITSSGVVSLFTSGFGVNGC